jgi:hypothetical protein
MFEINGYISQKMALKFYSFDILREHNKNNLAKTLFFWLQSSKKEGYRAL